MEPEPQVASTVSTAERHVPLSTQSAEPSSEVEAGAVAIPIPAPTSIAIPQTGAPLVRATRNVDEPQKITLAVTEPPATPALGRNQFASASDVTDLNKVGSRKRGIVAPTTDGYAEEPTTKRARTTRTQTKAQGEQDRTSDAAAITSRVTRSGKGRTNDAEPGTKDATPVLAEKVPKKAKARMKRSKKSLQDVAADVVAEAAGDETKQGRKRQLTPEEAETHEITTSAVTMGELIKDTRLGRKSERERTLQNTNWDEVKRKRRELEEARLAEAPQAADEAGRQVIQTLAPKMVLIGGNVVTATGSEFVDTTNGGYDEQTAAAPINEDNIVNRVTTATLGRKKNYLGRGKWNDEMTALFYRGLRMFGTDFMMISQMFPNLSRQHVKSKFVKEERQNAELIKQTLLGPREQVDLEEFSQMANKTYNDVAEFEKELEGERKQIEADLDKEKAEKAEQADASTILGKGDTAEGDAEGNLSAKENRFDGVAGGIVRDVEARGKKVKKGPKPKRNVARNKAPAGGEPQILGPINES